VNWNTTRSRVKRAKQRSWAPCSAGRA